MRSAIGRNRMPVEQLRANGSLLNEFVEAVPGAVYAKDRAGRILLGNEAFAEAVGWQSGGFVGKNDLELLVDKDLARTVMENDQRICPGMRDARSKKCCGERTAARAIGCRQRRRSPSRTGMSRASWAYRSTSPSENTLRNRRGSALRKSSTATRTC